MRKEVKVLLENDMREVIGKAKQVRDYLLGDSSVEEKEEKLAFLKEATNNNKVIIGAWARIIQAERLSYKN